MDTSNITTENKPNSNSVIPFCIYSDSSTILLPALLKESSDNRGFQQQIDTVNYGSLNAESIALPSCIAPNSLGAYDIRSTSARLVWIGGSTTVYDIRWRIVGVAEWTNVSSLTNTEYVLQGLTTGAAYEWQVRTLCLNSLTSEWVNGQLFTPPCLVPSQTDMSEVGLSISSVRFQWIVQSGIRYQFQWRKLNEINWQSSETIPIVPIGYYTSTAVTGLTTGATYEWRLRATCENGSISVTTSRTFVTQCTVPVYRVNTSLIRSNYVYLSFVLAEEGEYQVRWRPMGTSTWSEGPLANTSPYSITGLVVDNTYEWQVKGVCSSSETSSYSPTYTFTTRCGTPSVYTPSVQTTSAFLYWSSTETVHELRYRAAGMTSWNAIPAFSSTSFSLTGLTMGITYQWQVRSVCSPISYSDWVTGPNFTPTCILALYMEEMAISPTSLSMRWLTQLNVLYVVQWREQGNATWPNAISCISSGNTFFFPTITGLIPGTTYEWQVLTDCSGTLTPSGSRTFVAQCSIPKTLSYNSLSLSSRAVQLSWSGSRANDVNYRVHWRAIGTTDWLQSITTTSPMTVSGLANNTTYEWQIQAICGVDTMAYSSNGPNFTTTCVAPRYLYEPRASDVSELIRWYPLVNETFTLLYRSVGTPAWTTISSLSVSTHWLTGLTPGTIYEYQVSTHCGDGNESARSPIASFSTISACDSSEPNNVYQIATPISGTLYNSGDICLNSPGDQDWFRWEYNGLLYYILVHPFEYNTTGLYSLTLGFVNNVLQINTRSVNGTSTDTHLKLYAANGTTLLAENDDSNGTQFSEIIYTLPANCTAMTTVKTGLWTDPTVWSCGRVPTSFDAVQILHPVAIPANQIGLAGRVTHGAGGKVTFETGARLVLGQ